MNLKASNLRHPRRLRAALTATRNGLSSLLRLARPASLDGMTRPIAFEAHTMVRIAVEHPSALVTPLYPRDIR